MDYQISEDIKLAVKNGAAWLDENHEGWENRIDLPKLSMNSCTNCVVGQAVGEFYESIAEAAKSEEFSDDSFEWAAENGFHHPSNEDCHYSLREIDTYYRQLEAAWTEEVLRRRLG
jgi:hypothetical protein